MPRRPGEKHLGGGCELPNGPCDDSYEDEHGNVRTERGKTVEEHLRRNPETDSGTVLGVILFAAIGAGIAAVMTLGRNPGKAPPARPKVPSGPLTGPPDTPNLNVPSDALTDPTPGIDLWVDTRLPEGGWYGWTYIQRFTDTYEPVPGSLLPQRVSAQSKARQWLYDHAGSEAGAWSTATFDPTYGYSDVRYGLFGSDVASQTGDAVGTYASDQSLQKGYV